MTDQLSDLRIDGLDDDVAPRRLLEEPTRSKGRRSLAGLLVGALSLGTMGIIFAASSMIGTDRSAFGAHQDDATVAVSAFERSDDDQISRSVTRSELTRALSAQRVAERNQSLAETTNKLNDSSTQTLAELRDQASEAEIAKVKANAAKIAEEQKAAQKQLAAIAKQAKVSLPINASLSDTVVAPMKPGTYRIGAGFGATGSWARYHTGMDWVASTGTPVYATTDGIIGSSSGGAWAGIHVVLYHADGSANLYAHLSRKVVNPGDFVQAGQLVGYVGNTGRSFGSHLHFEYYKKGTTPGDVYSATNPAGWLRANGVKY